MSVVRRFLIAPSLVRLIRKERGGARITEGYFAPQAGRTSYVRIDGQDCHLVLVTTDAEGRSKEERTEVPRAHGDALLDVCSGKAAYERTTVPLGGRDVQIDRYVTPAGLDIASVTFDDEAASKAFLAPAWFGTDVSAEAGYDRHAVAIQGVPPSPEIGLSNAALNAVLDLIEPRFGFGNKPLRRPSTTETPAAAPLAPAPAPVAPPPPAPVAEASSPEPAESPAPMEVKAAEPAVETPPPVAHEAPKPGAPPASVEMKPVAAASEDKGDARIDDVIESLSQALSAAIQQPKEPAKDDALGGSFERWTVRPRRTNQQT
ncbi:hypothetical protein [Methylobacterium haplocladii]|uniref:CYTH domain-containing protein n=1 Tax=Methylobacterium haplocladii TaxID=1176176 RepID=A0A512IN25_9HYPH|nr:hypothetical protein [Methylobacterium haplocladii]GEO99078.1 hypothetical protein MHA02_14660 [Methylobacterium haplocladii]GJD84076.1 hypothetical protein HPGCJGGD_1951 [Methylobacterium haplocladii]GLS60067.1 hypothetical protein GCM10007887_27440 [Methylobacterium haplocladii]